MITLKILSIGNSFSQDAQKWLHQAAESVGKDIHACNLFIGGCSLSTHWEHYLDEQQVYDFEINGVFERKISLTEALNLYDWDIITLQQVSDLSGDYSSFEPYITYLYQAVKITNPKAKILLHETWAYEIDSTHSGFLKYNKDQTVMYNNICLAYKTASQKFGINVIPVGDVIQYLRENVEYFNYRNGGTSLNRDGFHLSLIYGRYAAAVTWLTFICGIDAEMISFVPVVEGFETDADLLKIINKSVKNVVKQNCIICDGI